eukprot:1362883-Pleurochrysis_carterae.AAC.1
MITRAVAAITVARQASLGIIKELSTRDSQLLSDDRPHRQGLWLRAFSVGGHSWVSGNLRNLKNTQVRKKCKNVETRMACEIERTFLKIKRRELQRYRSISQFLTTFPAGSLASKYQVPKLLGQTGSFDGYYRVTLRYMR